MTLGYLIFVIVVFCLLSWVVEMVPVANPWARRAMGMVLFIFILLFVLRLAGAPLNARLF